MIKLQVGQPKSGKTDAIKKQLDKITRKKIIFDFNQDYADVDGVEVDLEFFHPLVDKLSIDEVKVLNAGYLKSSHCLYRKSEDIFNETKEEKIFNVVQDSIERLNASLNDKWGEVEYARELSRRIPLKVNPKHISLDNIITLLEKNETVIVKSKSIHSSHLRAMMYMIIYKISKRTDLNIEIIADEVSTLFFKGNLKLLFQVIEPSDVDILMSCNRPSNIPIYFKELVDQWILFGNSDKSEIRFLRTKFGVGHGVNIGEIPFGEFILIENAKKELEEERV